MSLRKRILLIVVIAIAIYTVMIQVSHYMINWPVYVSLEKDQAKKDMERCVETIRREIDHVNVLCYVLAARDGTSEFVSDKNNEYIEANLAKDTFVDKKLNLIYIINEKGEVVWGRIFDLKKEETIQMGEFPPESFSPKHPLLSFKIGESPLGINAGIKGIFMTKHGPMMISSCPIITSKNKGPARGALIMGRFLNENIIEKVKEHTRLDFQLWSVQGDSIPKRAKTFLERITADNPHIINEHDKKLLEIYTNFVDIQGVPTLLLRVNVSRDITAKGRDAMQSDMLLTVVISMLVLIVLVILFQRAVVEPISKLTSDIVAIEKSCDPSDGLSVQRHDELGKLAMEINRILQQLSKSTNKLMEESYYSGISEMATGVLHNIHNALSPMITQIDVLFQEMHESAIEEIEMAQNELAEDEPKEGRKKELNRFVQLGLRNLAISAQDRKDKLIHLMRLVTRIEEILADQEKFTQAHRPVEQFSLYELLHDSAALLPNLLRKSVHVHIDQSIEKLRPITTRRLPLLQVFANLLFNAAESIYEAGSAPGEIKIYGGLDKVDGLDMIHLHIHDNGGGIEPDNIDRIFKRGFTTKQENSSGIGLYWCANTFAAMNGKLYVESKGKGHGACFHVLIPNNG